MTEDADTGSDEGMDAGSVESSVAVVPEAGAGADDLWGRVVGHDDLVRQLRAAALDPTHAYLFVGASGFGTRAAATAFAADLLAAGADEGDAQRHRRLCAEGRHPAVITVERVGASINVEQARSIVHRAAMSPPEGSLQVLILVDFHLVSTAGPMLLKSIEEPPPGTIFVVLADEVTPELVTIASRCVQFEFAPLSRSVVAAQLRTEGVPGEVADAAALGSGGDLDRARLLATDAHVIERRRFWFELPDRLDGTGSTAASLVTEVMARVEEVLAPLVAQQTAEIERLTEEAERLGQRKVALSEVDKRHKREQRRIRVDELRAGLAALMDAYRERATVDPDGYVQAAEAVGRVTDALMFNPNEELALQALLISLPARG